MPFTVLNIFEFYICQNTHKKYIYIFSFSEKILTSIPEVYFSHEIFDKNFKVLHLGNGLRFSLLFPFSGKKILMIEMIFSILD